MEKAKNSKVESMHDTNLLEPTRYHIVAKYPLLPTMTDIGLRPSLPISDANCFVMDDNIKDVL